MQFGIYAVHDKVAKLHHTPVFMKADQEAKRSFMQGINTKGTQLNDFPNDFALVKLGMYDEVSGQILVIASETICEGSEVPRKE